MDQLKALTRARQIILGAAVLLLIVSFFAWQSIEFEGVELASQNAWNGFWGVLMGLLTLAIIGWIAARALGVDLPPSIPDGVATLGVAVAILVCAVIKNLDDEYSAWASVVGIILAAVIVYGAWLNFQESGEELPSIGKSSATAGGAAAGSAAPPPASTPPEPAPAPAAPEPPPAPPPAAPEPQAEPPAAPPAATEEESPPPASGGPA